jgi:release factor glutamine methyltransferase
VNEHVLDPRPSSETLIEQALVLYKNQSLALRVLDLGSGSGCLLLSILTEYRNAYGIGIEKSQQACFVAHANAAKLGLMNRALFLLRSWCSCQDSGVFARKFNLIISNPPYIQSSRLMRYEVSKHEPRLALNGGAGGLVCYRQILSLAKNLLKFRGFLVMEIGQHQYISICRLVKRYGLELCGSAKDLSGIVRCVILQKTSEV